MHNQTVLSLKQVSKTFQGPDGNILPLQNLDLELNTGDFVSVRGSSGSGKSTLLMIAAALLRPDQGEVEIEDEKPFQLKPEQRAKFRADRVGMVFQQFHLIPYFSVLENILMPSLASANNGSGPAKERAAELMNQFGLKERAGHRPHELSVGEKQRTALARALLNRPKILLADEPTGNLDPENAQLVFRALSDFSIQGGAVLLVTHDERASGNAARELRLENGKLKEL